MSEFPPSRIALAVVAVCALALAACGPGGPETDGPAETGARTAPEGRVPEQGSGDALRATGPDPGDAARPGQEVTVDTSTLVDPADLAEAARDAGTDPTEPPGPADGAPTDTADPTDPTEATADTVGAPSPETSAVTDTARAADGAAGGGATGGADDAVGGPGEAERPEGDLLPPGAATDRVREPPPIPSPGSLRPREPLTVPAGSEMVLRMDRELTTRDARTGEAFHASLADDVLGLGGVVLVPAGARVRGRVVESRPSEGSGEPAVLRLAVEDLLLDGAHLPLHGEVVDVEVERGVRDTGRESAAKVGLGAVAGAVLGKLLGGDDRDALKGAAAGAAAGAAVAIATRDGHAVIGEGAVLRVRLDRPLRVERR